MKKTITILITFITFNLYAQDFSTILFIGRGSAADTYTIYINQLNIGTVKSKQTMECKMYSEGTINVDVVWHAKKKTQTMDIKHGETYYFECFGTEDRQVGKMKGKAILKENESTIKAEEGKNNVPATIPVTDNSIARQGTCFLINRKGYLITNYHIVRNAKTVQVRGIGGDFSTLYGADVVAYDVDLDMALIKIKNPNISFDSIPYRLSLETNTQGTKSFVLGYPLATVTEDTIKVTDGVISSKSGCFGSISEYQFSKPIQPGNSGSPLFNDKGDIVGIINAGLKDAEGTSYALKSQYIEAFLMSVDNVPADTPLSTAAYLTLPDKIAKLKNYIFIVKAE